MKKILFLGGIALSAMLMTGCSDTQKDVATDFSQKMARLVSENKMDSVAMLYPAAEMADSLYVKYNPDSLKVEKAEQDGIYKVTYSPNVTMTLKVDENGNVSVTESHGLFHYSKEKRDFAKKVGATEEGLNDATLAERMLIVDELSSDLYKKFCEERKNCIKITGPTVTKDIAFMMDEGRGYFTLTNTSSTDIDGSEYTVTWVDEWIDPWAGEGSRQRIEKGKKIAAGQSVNLPFSFSGRSWSRAKAVTVSNPTQDLFFMTYKPTGSEYSEYVKEHGAKPKQKAELTDGPYSLSGKLGGKYAIHMTIDKGMKTGGYYYDKNGAGAVLKLNVKSFNQRTGDIVLEEKNDKGTVTGTFTGVLTPENFSGVMTAYTGKSYDFDLKVAK